MISHRKLAIATGVLFLITDVTAIAARFLYGPILSDANYVTGSGPDTQVLMGVMLEVILALACVGVAVTLYPVVRRYNEAVALAYVGLRTLEASIIAVGVVPILAIVTMRQQLAGTAGADPATLLTLGSALVAFSNATFLVGPNLVVGVHTLLMAYLLYKNRLVPRFIPVLGLIGGPVVVAVNTGVMFGFIRSVADVGFLVLPILAWEVSLALWLIVKGFNSTRIASESGMTDVSRDEARRPAA